MICKIGNCFKKDKKKKKKKKKKKIQVLSLQDCMRLGANWSQHSILVLTPFCKDKKKKVKASIRFIFGGKLPKVQEKTVQFILPPPPGSLPPGCLAHHPGQLAPHPPPHLRKPGELSSKYFYDKLLTTL